MPRRQRDKRPHMAIRRKLGQRGRILLFFAASWTLIGLSIAVGIEVRHEAVPHLLIPETVRAAAWFATAAWAAICAFRVKDRSGFGWLFLMPAIRCWSWFYSWLMWLVPGAPEGAARGWYTGIVWALAMLFVAIEARRPEPQDAEACR